MIVIDASVWVSTLRPDEIHHRVSLEWVIAWTSSTRSLSVPAHFPAEITGVLGRQQVDRHHILEVLAEILRAPPFTIHPIVFALGERAAHVADGAGIGYVTRSYVALSEQLHLPHVTWDREQLERAGRLIDVLTPAQALERRM